MTLPLDLEDLQRKHEKWLIGTDDDAEMAQEWVMENLPALLAEVERLRDDQNRAIKYLTQLLTSLWPGTRALEKLNPLISQIDNGLTELKSLREQSFEKDEADVAAYEEALDIGREEADEELTTLRAKYEAMREALEPFARLVDECEIEREFQPGLVRAIRRARKALAEQGGA